MASGRSKVSAVAGGSGGPPRSVLVTVWLAAMVSVAALVVAVVLRTGHHAGSAASPNTSTSSTVTSVPPGAALRCDRGPCQVLASQVLGTDAVDLLGDPTGHSGRLRFTGPAGQSIFETTITQNGAQLTVKSLRCTMSATPACLVRADLDDGTTGEVFVNRSGGWSRAELPFWADGAYLELDDITGDGVPRVITVQRSCGAEPSSGCQRAYAQVFTLTGEDVGCTKAVADKTQLPGWPVVAPPVAQLRPCP